MHRRVLLAIPLLLPAATARGQQHRAAPSLPLPLPGGMSPLRDGAYRLTFRTGETAMPAGVAPTLAEIGRRLNALPAGSGRITVEAQSSGPSNDASAARRTALARANLVRDALVAGGLDSTRVDVRALGRQPAALDAADILPPGARVTAEAATTPPTNARSAIRSTR